MSTHCIVILYRGHELVIDSFVINIPNVTTTDEDCSCLRNVFFLYPNSVD